MMIWHDFLLNQSIHTAAQDDPLLTKAAPTLSLYSPYVTELCQKSSFFVTGPDKQTFLQGQLTTDCDNLSPQQARPTAICNPKGRTIATGIVTLWEDGILITVDSSMKDAVIKHLKKFVFLAKVTISELPELILLELGGEAVGKQLEEHLGTQPDPTPYRVTRTDHSQLIALPGEAPRWMIASHSPESMIALWKNLTEIAKPIGTIEAKDIELQSKVLTIDAALTEQFLPQMFDYDLIHGMSLKKGCYAGQEVLARASHRGTIKRQLYRGHCDNSAALSIGMPILMGESEIGTLVARSQGNMCQDILMILRTPALENKESISVGGQHVHDVKRAKPLLSDTKE